MFGFLCGKIKIIREDHIILDSSGCFGFIIFLPKNLIKNLVCGESYEFLIETRIKNSEQIFLFGFENEFQRIFFNHLCSISGISDKLALNLCSVFPPKDLLDYCIQNKTKLDIKIDGLGPKTWEKILFYLGRNKNLHQICLEFISLNKKISINLYNERISSDNSESFSNIISEAKMALISLGIPSSFAQNLVEKVIENHNGNLKSLKLEDLIKNSLNNYNNN